MLIEGERETELSRGDLADRASRAVCALRRFGAARTPVLLLVARAEDFLTAFWGALAAGMIPVPVALPAGTAARGGDLDRLLGVWRKLGAPIVIVDAMFRDAAIALAEAHGLTTAATLTPADLLGDTRDDAWHEPAPDDLAFLQFSSGSTGDPKGVELTHANVLANLSQLTSVTHLGPDDVVVSWMPYTHDMGLVGTHLASLLAGATQVKLDPLEFVANPSLWFEAAHRHHATILATANFALGLSIKKVSDPGRFELGRVRIIANGGEPVSPRLCRAFFEHFAPSGLRPSAMVPMYGLAEATLGVAIPSLGQGLCTRVVARGPLEREGRVELVDAFVDPSQHLELVEVGAPLPGITLRIVDDEHHALPALVVGNIEVAGPNITRGFFGDARVGEWLHTGDLGFLVDGRLCVTGRAKDLIIVRGRKLFAHDVEAIAESVPGVRAGKACACGFYDAAAGEERAILFIGTTDDDVVEAVTRKIRSVLGIDLERVVRIAADAFPKTTSGKLQRFKLRDAYLAGELTATRSERARSRDIAVIAMSCRFPDAATPEAFFDALCRGHDAVREVPADRWAKETYYPSRTPSKWGAFLDDVAAFDASFFGLDDAEAAVLDPQHRLLLELSYEALERAGHRRGGRVGVFVGAGSSEYGDRIVDRALGGGDVHPSSAVGNLRNLIAARVAHMLDLHGPALVVDTACSSSLVALHLAREALNRGECDAALVGGVSLNLTVAPYLLLGRAGALSPRGRCHAFSEDADGFVPGEGAGVVMIKRLADAERDGDPILAIVRGTAMNNDGRSISPMAPSVEGQQAVIEAAWRDAELDPTTASYVEAHGTGTAIGDPIEARSIAKVMRKPVLLGSAKGNVGHLLAAAGMVSLIKVVSALQNKRIPPSLHCSKPRSDLESLRVVRELTEWHGSARRAGIDAFGFGGTNAHVVLEEAPPRTEHSEERPFELVVCSAADEPALQRRLAGLAVDASLGDIAADAASREPLAHRAAIVASTTADLRKPVRVAAVSPRRPPRVAFVFAGQGAQYAGQGRVLFESWPSFRKQLERTAAIVRGAGGPDPIAACFSGRDEDLRETRVAQPLLCAFEIALARTLMALGVTPSSVVGHSVGELAAAAIAGIISDETALRIATVRGRVMDSLRERGRMAAVFAPMDAVVARVALHADASIAAVNARHQVVIAGADAAIDSIVTALEQDGFTSTRLNVSHAFHSPLMRPLREALAAAIGVVPRGRATTPMISTVTGAAVEALDAQYWVEHAEKPVLFADAIEQLRATEIFLEIGPGATLAAPLRVILEDRVVVSALRKGDDDRHALLSALAQLWVRGVPLDVRALAQPRRHTVLPTYPFARTRHWLDVEPTTAAIAAPLLGRRTAMTIDGASYQARFDRRSPLVADHVVLGVNILPAAACWELALEAARDALGRMPGGLSASTFRRPLDVQEDSKTVTVSIERRTALHWSIRDGDELLGEGTVLEVVEKAAATDLDAIRARCAEPFDPKELYRRLSEHGMRHGPYFQRIAELSIGPGEVLARLSGVSSESTVLDPALGDAAVQGIAALLMQRNLGRDVLYIPFAVDRVSIAAEVRGDCYAHLTLLSEHDEVLRCDVTICDATGKVLARIAGLSLKRARTLPIADRRIDGFMHKVAREPAQRRERTLPSRVAILGGGDVARELSAALASRGIDVSASSDMVIDLRGIEDVPLLPTALLTARPGLIVTRGTDPARAAWHAFSRALAEERRDVRAIEVRSGDLVAQLVAELSCDGPSTVVLDQGLRLVPVLRATAVSGVSPYREGGTYVISGGGSGIGLAIACDLRRRFRARVIVLGRRPAPPDLDAEYRRVDVSDAAAVKRTLDELGPIDGIFHAAGVILPGLARDKTASDLETTFAGKVRGAEALIAAAPDVRFIALFSSVSAALPRFAGGLADYAAANAALDAIACRVGAPVISIAWGAWGETGMGASEEHRALAARVGLQPITTEDGLRACERAIGSGLSHVVVLDEVKQPIAAEATQVAVEGDLLDVVRALVARATRLPPADIGLDESLLSLGLESLAAVEIVKTLETKLGRRLPTTLLFEHPTLRRAVAAMQSATPVRAAAPVDDGTLSATQRAILLGEDLNPTLPPYSFLRVTLPRAMDRATLQRAAAAVVARHPSLRTSIVTRERQAVHPTATLALEEVDDESEFRARPFDRTQAPLFRLGIRDRDLLFCAHHALADAWSLAILARDLLAICAGTQLPPLQTTPAQVTALAPREADRRYFRERLAELPPSPRFLGDTTLSGPVHTVETRVDRATTDRLRKRAASLGVSLFHLLAAVHVQFIAREGAEGDVLLNIAHARRDARVPDAALVIGGFADTLPVRLADADLAILAPATRDAVTAALAHGSVSSIDLAPLLAGRRTPSLSFASFPLERDVELVDFAGSTAGPTTALGAAAWEINGELRFAWSGASSVRSREALVALVEHHRALLAEAADGSIGRIVADIGIIGSITAHERFVARAAAVPHSIAVIDGDRALTYGALERASRAVARELRGARVVAVRIGSGADAVIAILGALRAGAAYLPLDPGFPEARLARMQAHADRSLTADDVRRIVAADDGAPLDAPAISATTPAYVLFTSGSTGEPKRVTVSHSGLAKFLDATQRCFELRPDDRCVQTASLCFDASVRQLFAPLAVGATLLPASPDLLHAPEELVEWMVREQITVWGSVPSLFGRIVASLERSPAPLALRWVILGGEPLRAGLLRRFFDVHSGARVANVYGPTETTVNVTCQIVSARPAEDAVDIPIGRSIGTADVVLEGTEIVVRGDAVALGLGGEYRTGDHARMADDGTLTFIGRSDRQIKLRGYRIELAEIESAILAHPGVTRVVASLDGERLRAHVEGRVDVAQLRAALQTQLPQYMIPHELLLADALPSTATGKLDRARLGDDPRQATIARAFAEALGVEDVSPDDDFFALGGDSILALDVFVRLRAELGRAPRAAEIFRHRTPRALARIFDDGDSVPAAATGAPGVLSPVQAGFWIAQRIAPDVPSNWCASIHIEGPLDLARLRAAIAAVSARHPMVRASFDVTPDGPRQRIDAAPIVLEVVEGDLVEEIAARERAHLFDLSRAPLVRLTLVRRAAGDHVLLATAHHIIGDAWSGRIFARDLFAAYDGEPLSPLTARFEASRPRALSIAHFRAMFAEKYDPPLLRRGAASGVATGRITVPAEPVIAAARARGETVSTLLLAAWARRLRVITGRTDLVIGIATAGREPAVADVFGPFAHALPVRLRDEDVDGAVRATLAHADASLQEIAALAPRIAGTAVSAIAQLFFTFVDADALPAVTARDLKVIVGRAESHLTESASDLVLAVLKHDGLLEIRIDAAAAVATEAELGAHVRSLAADLIPADAALITYLPTPAHISALLGVELSREQVRAVAFADGRPRRVDRVRTRLGTSATILIPRFADELSQPGLAEDVTSAAQLAAEGGARIVSLAGMLPSHTAYGAALELPTRLTTGHATTVVAVVRTIASAAARMKLQLAGASIAFLGVGSIGQSALELMLAVLPHPRRITLLDVPSTHERLHALRLPFAGEVRVDTPAHIDGHDLIVGATSVPGVLDVDRLARGTIVVDDSFPPCFDPIRAHARTARGEILVVSGGTLDCGAIERDHLDLPAELAGRIRAVIALHALPGCQLEPLLLATDPSLPATVGLVSPAVARAMWDATERLGIVAAPLRLGQWLIDEPTLDTIALVIASIALSE